MSYLNGIQQQRAEEIERQSGWDCGRHEDTVLTEQEQSEHEQQCLDAMLEAYITEEGNYAVNGASIKCSQMTGKPVFFKFDREGTKMWIEGEKGIATKTVYPQKKSFDRIVPPIDKGRVGKLFAVHGETQTVNGIPYATVIDRTCLRQETNSKDGGQDKCDASIVSCGNCKLLLKHDIENIAGNWDKAVQYGTCYCLIKPREEWTNPRCTESVVGNCDTGDTVPECKIERHHHIMTFSTTEGDKEGLTMLSTLLCYRGGIITIEKSGQSEQIYINDIEAKIQMWMNTIEGESVSTTEEMFQMSTVEVLARLIYQEDRNIEGQSAVMFTVMNRLFSKGTWLRSIQDSNQLYSIVTASGQYDSVLKDWGAPHNAFRPPTDPNVNSSERKAWENAKRLAVILYIAVEKYGCSNENENVGETHDKEGNLINLEDRNENVVEIDDDDTREDMICFIEQQYNIDNDNIINEIGKKIDFRSRRNGVPQRGGIVIGGNEFF